MPELLLELFSEEIPARMQAKAAEDLRALVTNGLVDAGLTYEGAQAHATPRRLVLSIEGLTAQSKDTREERKGPKVDAPQAAIDGFLKSTGLTLDQLQKQDDKKGAFYLAVIKRNGRMATDVIAELVPDVIRKFPWPKSMRWGSGTLRWVRPLHSILCCFDGDVVPFEVDGIKSGHTTKGHRFLAPAEISARRFEDYSLKLHKAHVIVDANTRAETIKTEAKNLAFAQGLEVVEDEALFKEVAGLVEWPVVLMGEFDKTFLDVPPEVIITTIKNNQKCFCVRDAKGKLANKYILIANTVPKDGGAEIIRGNNKVIAARLSDAKFFWDQDRKTKLEDLAAQTRYHHLPRQTRHPRRTRQTHRSAGRRNCQDHRCRCRENQTRCAFMQSRPRHQHGRRIPRTARRHGPLLRARRRDRPRSRRRHPRPLETARAERLAAGVENRAGGGAGGQAGYAGWVLGD